MTPREDVLSEFESVAAGLLAQFDGAQRRRLLKLMAADLRRSQQKRIGAQKDPDGADFEPRRPRKRDRAKIRPVRFLYRKPAGATRVAAMKSYQLQGPRLTGFDTEARGLRTFRKDRIDRHLPPSGGADSGALSNAIRGRKGAVRRKAAAMFDRLRKDRNLRASGDERQAWVEFTGRAARIARIHHYGLRDRVARDGPEHQYPQRRLLGFSLEDREALLTALLRHMGEAL